MAINEMGFTSQFERQSFLFIFILGLAILILSKVFVVEWGKVMHKYLCTKIAK